MRIGKNVYFIFIIVYYCATLPLVWWAVWQERLFIFVLRPHWTGAHWYYYYSIAILFYFCDCTYALLPKHR